MAAFNFQPIIQPGQVAQGVNDDFNRRQAVFDSITSGIGDFGKSIEKLGEWKKTMDERDERLAIKNGIVDKQNAARGAYDAINGEQFDVNSVDRNPFKVAAKEASFIMPEGAEDIGDHIRYNGGDYSKDSIKAGNYFDIGLGYSAPTAESFDDEGYNAAVEKARSAFDADKAARLAEAKKGVDSFGWNDSENPVVQTAWEEYVRNGNSTLLANLQSQHNAELTRKALEAKAEAEKNAAEQKALTDKVNGLGRQFNTALKTYIPMKASIDPEGLAVAQNGVATMENIISELQDLGYDTSDMERQMSDAVGEKVETIKGRIAGRKTLNKRVEQKKQSRNAALLDILNEGENGDND